MRHCKIPLVESQLYNFGFNKINNGILKEIFAFGLLRALPLLTRIRKCKLKAKLCNAKVSFGLEHK